MGISQKAPPRVRRDCSPLQRSSRTWYLGWPSREARKYFHIRWEFDGITAPTQTRAQGVANHLWTSSKHFGDDNL